MRKGGCHAFLFGVRSDGYHVLGVQGGRAARVGAGSPHVAGTQAGGGALEWALLGRNKHSPKSRSCYESFLKIQGVSKRMFVSEIILFGA